MSESQYLIQQVLGEGERSENKSVSEWFSETQKIMKEGHMSRWMFTPPESGRMTDFYGLSKILVEGESRVELSEHSKDKDYKDDHDYLSLSIYQGLGIDRQNEQFVVLKDKDSYLWFWREMNTFQWRELPQNKVPLYAIFSITEKVR